MDHQQVIRINQPRSFNVEEAQSVGRLIFKMTQKSSEEVESLVHRLEAAKLLDQDRVSEIEKRINQLIQGWQRKVESLGAIPRGLWLVDYDSGNGYFCWKYPEPIVEFWHSYQNGYSKRMHISEIRDKFPIAEKIKNALIHL